MLIREMFASDIERKINGVVQVEQDEEAVIWQEVEEYVITRELKKHFLEFFSAYTSALRRRTNDIGVWISGFFGSGKSHFLKMLSYILENREINGTTTVEMFRKKFADDPGSFMLIDEATQRPTETILFNIGVEQVTGQALDPVLLVFAKMFYRHLGFYGDDLKVTMLEQYVESMGKTAEFQRLFQERKGKSWIKQRKVMQFNSRIIISLLQDVVGMGEAEARAWFTSKDTVAFSIERLVKDIKDYVDSKPENFRLIFLVDEVGQYVGDSITKLLSLQNIVEKIGSICAGKVWVMCTGQEAIDEILKVRNDEFSRIQARFKTHLSLTSSSVDEVIQKRILRKTPAATNLLEAYYAKQEATLRNLFSFRGSVQDIKGYSTEQNFAENFPFVPYQFIIMPKVFAQIRKHGNAGMHLSGGERSMLSGFQEAAQKVKDRDEGSLVPFYLFYDTVHSFLDSSIRQVIERCAKAAREDAGVEPYDVHILKLLYLLRYIDDIPSTVDNIVILMADTVAADKIKLRERVTASLERLVGQNYVSQTGETYNFLTDAEQDIQREINAMVVDTAAIIEKIGKIVYLELLKQKKYSYRMYNFDYERKVDEHIFAGSGAELKLKLLTVASDETERENFTATMASEEKALVVLGQNATYYENFEKALKIEKYIKQRNVQELPESVQSIIRGQQEQARRYAQQGQEQLYQAIVQATIYVDGEKVKCEEKEPKQKLEKALSYLVQRVYTKLDLIEHTVESEEEIRGVLAGHEETFTGMEADAGAKAAVEDYLRLQEAKKLPTSMGDVHARFQVKPYGWREIDIAYVVAILIHEQKVTLKYNGAVVSPEDSRMVDYLRSRSFIGSVKIALRQAVSEVKLKKVRVLLREYTDKQDIPEDEDGLVSFIKDYFAQQQAHYATLANCYIGERTYPYPGRSELVVAQDLVRFILSQCKDNIALFNALLAKEEELQDSKEDMEEVEDFFAKQCELFDEAAALAQAMECEGYYLQNALEATQALCELKAILTTKDRSIYRKIPRLKELIAAIKLAYEKILMAKKQEVEAQRIDCLAAIHQAINIRSKAIGQQADRYYEGVKQKIEAERSIAMLVALAVQMEQEKEKFLKKIEQCEVIADGGNKGKGGGDDGGNDGGDPPLDGPPPTAKYPRNIVFKTGRLRTQEDIEAYVAQMRGTLRELVEENKGIELT